MMSGIGNCGRLSCQDLKPVGSRGGFTLVELLIVVSIIVVMAGSAFPNMKCTVDQFRFRSAAEDFRSVLDRTNNRAIWEGKIIHLAIDSASNEYRLFDNDDEYKSRVFRIPKGLQLKSDKDEILFYPDGSIDVANMSLISSHNEKAIFLPQGAFGGIKVQYS